MLIYLINFYSVSKIFAVLLIWENSMNKTIFAMWWSGYTLLMLILSLYAFKHRKIVNTWWYWILILKLLADIIITAALWIDVSFVKASNDNTDDDLQTYSQSNSGSSDNSMFSMLRNDNSSQFLITMPLYIILIILILPEIRILGEAWLYARILKDYSKYKEILAQPLVSKVFNLNA